jgi:hypothetical protein
MAWKGGPGTRATSVLGLGQEREVRVKVCLVWGKMERIVLGATVAFGMAVRILSYNLGPELRFGQTENPAARGGRVA